MWKINCIHILTKNSLKLGFSTGRDIATFRDSGTGKTFLSRDKGTPGQKFLHCPGTKGQRGKLKILPRDGTGRAGTVKIRDGTRDKTGQGRKECSKTGKGCSKIGKDVLKQENDVPKQDICSFFLNFLKFILSRDVPGRPGTEEFVPGHLLLPLSRDKGTAELFCPGTKGQRDVPSLGNPIKNRQKLCFLC